MARRTKPQICEHCGTSILRRRDVENHMRAYHSEQEDDTVSEPVEGMKCEQQPITDIDDNAPASQAAIGSLAAIKKQFNEFCINNINHQLAEIEEEEALLEQDLHPDQIEQLAVTRKFVNDRLQPEQAQHKYSVLNAKFNLESGTEILHSQYFQEARFIREKYIERGQDELHKVRKANAVEDQEEKEAAEGAQPKGKFGAHYKTDDRGMFVKERKIAKIGKSRQQK